MVTDGKSDNVVHVNFARKWRDDDFAALEALAAEYRRRGAVEAHIEYGETETGESIASLHLDDDGFARLFFSRHADLYVVENDKGKPVARGADLAELIQQLSPT